MIRIVAIVLVLVMFGIPAIMLATLVNLWWLLLLFGLIFVPVLLLQPAIDRSRR